MLRKRQLCQKTISEKISNEVILHIFASASIGVLRIDLFYTLFLMDSN